jgi:hypothetical protein
VEDREEPVVYLHIFLGLKTIFTPRQHFSALPDDTSMFLLTHYFPNSFPAITLILTFTFRCLLIYPLDSFIFYTSLAGGRGEGEIFSKIYLHRIGTVPEKRTEGTGETENERG